MTCGGAPCLHDCDAVERHVGALISSPHFLNRYPHQMALAFKELLRQLLLTLIE